VISPIGGGNGANAPRVGVLALQGAFAAHAAVLDAIGATAVRVTDAATLETVDALILPGGESTTMIRLIESNGLRAPLTRFFAERPVLGTCAGVILLGEGGEHLPAPPFGVLDVTVTRNAYGRQIDSFEEPLEAPPLGGAFTGIFIRAPRISRIGDGVTIVARRTAAEAHGEPVGVRAGRIAGLCFHPELTGDTRFHRWFLTEVAGLPALAPPAPRAAVAEVA
jgi:5'-phosphate synthase pdxT subunit